MNDIFILLIFLCFLFILMPRKKKDKKKQTHKRKKKKSKRRSKRIENLKNHQKNIYDEPLETCSTNPMTGWFRDGYCNTDDNDSGTHTVCSELTDEFLKYTKSQGNDLSTPRGNFPGLKQGDNWCLCALRWHEAQKKGKAPKINLKATNRKTLEYINKKTLENYNKEETCNI